VAVNIVWKELEGFRRIKLKNLDSGNYRPPPYMEDSKQMAMVGFPALFGYFVRDIVGSAINHFYWQIPTV
jgi:hypothetical protein